MPDHPPEISSSAPRGKLLPARKVWQVPFGPLIWLFRFTRGLIHDQHTRRLTMFYVILAAMLMAFLGEFLMPDWRHTNRYLFVGYYLACAWLTIVAALLAIYDLLILRLQHRVIRRQLRVKMLGEEQPEDQ